MSTIDTSGAATRFATGEITEKVWNVAIDRGAVAAWAVNVRASGPPMPDSRRGSAPATHASASRANSTRPATAATESWKPRSNATGGDASSATPAAAERPATASVRRPATDAMVAIAAIPHARTAEACTPVATT